MIKAFILICASAMPHGDCTERTALKVVRIPDPNSLQQCLFSAQAMIAPTDLAPTPGKEYAKTVCSLGVKMASRLRM